MCIRDSYKSVLDVDPTHFTARNYEYLKLVYEGSPSKTIVLKVGTAVENLNPQLKQLNDLKWNYLVIPGITDDEKTTVSAWIKEARDDHHKTFKAVLPNCTADHEGIINLTTDNITSTPVSYTHLDVYKRQMTACWPRRWPTQPTALLNTRR